MSAEERAAKTATSCSAPKLLEQLRQHWRRIAGKNQQLALSRQPLAYSESPDRRQKTLYHACQKSRERAGINRPIHPHTLASLFRQLICSRAGADLRTIQILLGHQRFWNKLPITSISLNVT